MPVKKGKSKKKVAAKKSPVGIAQKFAEAGFRRFRPSEK